MHASHALHRYRIAASLLALLLLASVLGACDAISTARSHHFAHRYYEGPALQLAIAAEHGDVRRVQRLMKDKGVNPDTVFGGKPRSTHYDAIPSAVFSQPPIASVGLSEADARAQLGEVKIYTSDFRPMQNMFATQAERGFYKLVVDAETDKVVGIHMIGPDAPEILQAAAIAVKAGLTKAQFDDTIALHPSMAEELVLMR